MHVPCSNFGARSASQDLISPRSESQRRSIPEGAVVCLSRPSTKNGERPTLRLHAFAASFCLRPVCPTNDIHGPLQRGHPSTVLQMCNAFLASRRPLCCSVSLSRAYPVPRRVSPKTNINHPSLSRSWETLEPSHLCNATSTATIYPPA